MYISEKVSYLRGLIEGLDISKDSKEGKIYAAMLDIFDEISCSIDDINGEVDELYALTDEIDSDLGDVEEAVYTDSCCNEEDEDEDIEYEVTCPECGEVIGIDDEISQDGEVICPTCGERFEFELPEEDECEEGCDCGCEHEHEHE